MEQSKKDKLIEYSKKMLLRGDSYIDISIYLDKEGADEDFKKEVFLKLEQVEDKRKKETKKEIPVSIPTIIIGIVLFILSNYFKRLGYSTFACFTLNLLAIVLIAKEVVKWILFSIKSLKNK